MSLYMSLIGHLSLASCPYTLFLYLIFSFPKKLQKHLSSCSRFLFLLFYDIRNYSSKKLDLKAARKVIAGPFPPSSLSIITQIRIKVPIISLYCSFLLAFFQFQFICYKFSKSLWELWLQLLFIEPFPRLICHCIVSFLKHRLMHDQAPLDICLDYGKTLSNRSH